MCRFAKLAHCISRLTMKKLVFIVMCFGILQVVHLSVVRSSNSAQDNLTSRSDFSIVTDKSPKIDGNLQTGLAIKNYHLSHFSKDLEEQGRRRKRHNMMAPFMMFGVIAMLMILVPMGFKFLTILGAKALLLAKMALLLTSIQGLKKIATNGIDYGFYHASPPHDRQNPWMNFQEDDTFYHDSLRS